MGVGCRLLRLPLGKGRCGGMVSVVRCAWWRLVGGGRRLLLLLLLWWWWA